MSRTAARLGCVNKVTDYLRIAQLQANTAKQQHRQQGNPGPLGLEVGNQQVPVAPELNNHRGSVPFANWRGGEFKRVSRRHRGHPRRGEGWRGGPLWSPALVPLMEVDPKNHGAERTNGRKRKEELRETTATRSQKEHCDHNATELRMNTTRLEKSSHSVVLDAGTLRNHAVRGKEDG